MKPMIGRLILIHFMAFAILSLGCSEANHQATAESGALDYESLGLELYLGDPSLYSSSQSLFSNNCVACHNPSDPATSKFRDILDTEELVKRGVLKPGNADGSLVHQVIANGSMPPEGISITQSEMNLIRDWINSMGFITNN